VASKKKVGSVGMKVKTYDILERAVEEGIRSGYRRAFKHTENPLEEELKESIRAAVMLRISEDFTFDDLK